MQHYCITRPSTSDLYPNIRCYVCIHMRFQGRQSRLADQPYIAMSINLVCYDCLRSISYLYSGMGEPTQAFKGIVVRDGRKGHHIILVRCNACAIVVGKIETFIMIGYEDAVSVCIDIIEDLAGFHGGAIGLYVEPHQDSSSAEERIPIRDADSRIAMLGNGRVCRTLNLAVPTRAYDDFISLIAIDVPVRVVDRAMPEEPLRSIIESMTEVGILDRNV
ncbi:hypothetical protein BJX65DRAFT_49387 [Aspergillus insuetus]